MVWKITTFHYSIPVGLQALGAQGKGRLLTIETVRAAQGFLCVKIYISSVLVTRAPILLALPAVVSPTLTACRPSRSQLAPLDQRDLGRVLGRARHVSLLARVQGLRRSVDRLPVAAPVGSGPHRGGDARRPGGVEPRRGRRRSRRAPVRCQVRERSERRLGMDGS